MLVFRWSCFPQIHPPIVMAPFIDVINLIFRPAPCHVQPCQSMSQEAFSSNIDVYVSIWLYVARLCAGWYAAVLTSITAARKDSAL